MTRYKMRHSYNQNMDESIAHKGIYTTISEIMSRPYINPDRSLEWIPKGCKTSEKGNTLYFVGCLPFFNYEFDNLDLIAKSTLQILYKVEKEPIVVFKDEICCGHDIYWGQGKLKTFIKLAIKNIEMFEKAGISTIVTACAECYRTFKIDYQKIFEDFNERFEVKHIIEYIYEMWKEGKIEFINTSQLEEQISFTYHDPCRLSRFLPKENNITE
ncbi:MAG: (Fe-S)-binding protein, partial [Promethearchaeota archaeon]